MKTFVGIALGASMILGGCGSKTEAEAKAEAEKAAAELAKALGDTAAKPAKPAAAPAAAPAKPAAPAAPAKPAVQIAKPDMAKLVIKGEKWEGEHNKALGSWTFEKYTPAGDGTNEVNRFYVDEWDTDKPSDAAAFAEKLKTDKNFLDMGSLYTKIDKTEKIGDGWLITGIQKDMSDDEDKGMIAFSMLNATAGIFCHGSVFRTPALMEEAIAGCKAATAK